MGYHDNLMLRWDKGMDIRQFTLMLAVRIPEEAMPKSVAEVVLDMM